MKIREDRQSMGEQIQHEVDETFASLDRMERLQAGPAFYTKLRARLDADASLPAPSRWPLLPGINIWILRPVVLSLLVLGNLLTILSVARAGQSLKADKPTTATILAAEYGSNADLDEIAFSREEMRK